MESVKSFLQTFNNDLCSHETNQWIKNSANIRQITAQTQQFAKFLQKKNTVNAVIGANAVL